MNLRLIKFRRSFLVISYLLLAFILSAPNTPPDAPKESKSGSETTEKYKAVVDDFFEWIKEPKEFREKELRRQENHFKEMEGPILLKYKDHPEELSEFYKYRDKVLTAAKEEAAFKDAIFDYFQSNMKNVQTDHLTVD